jgi:sigma-B regulation protein RsbU (phosphoserine phosphatase)
MEILIADDDSVARMLLDSVLENWGHQVVVVNDGQQAWDILSQPDAPRLAIVDWMMPRIDGPELCRRIRRTPETLGLYVILLTSRRDPADIISGLQAGADDYIVKPFEPEEMRARLGVGLRVVALQNSLNSKITELKQALAQVHTLQGLIPICAYCKRIRNEAEFWERVESYITARSDARFSHGICPDCVKKVSAEFTTE